MSHVINIFWWTFLVVFIAFGVCANWGTWGEEEPTVEDDWADVQASEFYHEWVKQNNNK